MRSLRRSRLVLLLGAMTLLMVASPASAQDTPDQPPSVDDLGFDRTIELIFSTLREFSDEDFTYWQGPREVNRMEIRVVSDQQAEALGRVFGPALPSPFVLVVGDLGIDPPKQPPASVNDLTYEEKIAARDAFARRLASRYVDRSGGSGLAVSESGEVTVFTSSEEIAALARQFFGPDVSIAQGITSPLPIPEIPSRSGGALITVMLAVMILGSVGGGWYWHRRIGHQGFVASLVVAAGASVILVSLTADSWFDGYPGRGLLQTAGIALGVAVVAFGVLGLASALWYSRIKLGVRN